jgi:hypothetical protein
MGERELAAWHEAGHAVAAVMRGESRLKSVALDEERHGAGLTEHSSKSFDNAFIAFAGPWAEARYGWGDRPLDDDDDDGLYFDDHLFGVQMEQPADAAILESARAEARAAGLPPDSVWHTEQVWQMELERVWSAIAAVAGALRAGATVTHEGVESLVDRAFENDTGGQA